MSAWCKELGLSPGALHTRFINGWSLGRALSTPNQNKNHRKSQRFAKSSGGLEGPIRMVAPEWELTG